MSTTETDPIAERFARETANHELSILHDDGPYRHLHFQAPGHSAYWFDLITVPGSLIFRGDGESFVFARVPDMFAFFRSNPDRGTMPISPDYWAQKLTSNREAVKIYSRALLEQHVAEALAEAETDWPGVTDKWKFETDDSIDYDLDYEDSAREALRDFRHTVDGHDAMFEFSDTWEWDLAIVYGIATYDAAKTAAAATPEAVAA